MNKRGFTSVLILLIIPVVVAVLAIGYIARNNNSFKDSVKNSPILSKITNQSTEETSKTKHTETIDVTRIPLGDGKVSTTPKVGYVYSCQTTFRGGGADHSGNWVNGDTWNLNKKIHVSGDVSWPNAKFSVNFDGNNLILSGNGLPTNATTGTFPIQRSDEAWNYDRNPNSIKEQNDNLTLPNPQIASSPTCVPMGAIGYALNGVAIYNALDDAGRDAVAHEVQDKCDGHPQSAGEYHYHGPSDCMANANENNTLVGYALDGFGIYSKFDANGKEYTNADLDECHGITSEVEWNGKMVNMYHYVLTQEYPYTVGCFKGTPVKTKALNQGAQTQQGNTGTKTPPQEAISVCSGKSVGSSCSFQTPNGTISGSCKQTPSSMACVPN